MNHCLHVIVDVVRQYCVINEKKKIHNKKQKKKPRVGSTQYNMVLSNRLKTNNTNVNRFHTSCTRAHNFV